MVNNKNKKILSLASFLVGVLIAFVAILNFSDNLKLTGHPLNDSVTYMIELFIGLFLVAIGIFNFPFGKKST